MINHNRFKIEKMKDDEVTLSLLNYLYDAAMEHHQQCVLEKGIKKALEEEPCDRETGCGGISCKHCDDLNEPKEKEASGEKEQILIKIKTDDGDTFLLPEKFATKFANHTIDIYNKELERVIDEELEEPPESKQVQSTEKDICRRIDCENRSSPHCSRPHCEMRTKQLLDMNENPPHQSTVQKDKHLDQGKPTADGEKVVCEKFDCPEHTGQPCKNYGSEICRPPKESDAEEKCSQCGQVHPERTPYQVMMDDEFRMLHQWIQEGKNCYCCGEDCSKAGVEKEKVNVCKIWKSKGEK